MMSSTSLYGLSVVSVVTKSRRSSVKGIVIRKIFSYSTNAYLPFPIFAECSLRIELFVVIAAYLISNNLEYYETISEN